MALKTLCAKEKMVCCLRAPITWNEAPMLTMYVLSVFFFHGVCMLRVLQPLLAPRCILWNFDHAVVRSDSYRQSG